MALGTVKAALGVAGRIGTEVGSGAAKAIRTVIEGMSPIAGLLNEEVRADFFGDGSAVTGKLSGDLFKGRGSIQEKFNGRTFLQG